MALQAAMDFIEAIRVKPELAAALANVGDYEDLRRIGESAGFVFTGDELDLAFRHRCSMRWLRHFSKCESKRVKAMPDAFVGVAGQLRGHGALE